MNATEDRTKPMNAELRELETSLVKAAETIADSAHAYDDDEDGIIRGEDDRIEIVAFSYGEAGYSGFSVKVKAGGASVMVYRRRGEDKDPATYRKGRWIDHVKRLAARYDSERVRADRFITANATLDRFEDIDDSMVFGD